MLKVVSLLSLSALLMPMVPISNVQAQDQVEITFINRKFQV